MTTIHNTLNIEVGSFYKTERFGDKVLYMGIGMGISELHKGLVIVLDDIDNWIGHIVIPGSDLWEEGFILQPK